MHSNDDVWAKILAMVFGVAIVVWAAVAGVGGLVTRIQCGAWPESMGPGAVFLSLIHISEPTRRTERSRMPSSA